MCSKRRFQCVNVLSKKTRGVHFHEDRDTNQTRRVPLSLLTQFAIPHKRQLNAGVCTHFPFVC